MVPQLTDVEIVDRINATTRSYHDEQMLVLRKVAKRLESLDAFRNKLIGASMAASLLISIAWHCAEAMWKVGK